MQILESIDGWDLMKTSKCGVRDDSIIIESLTGDTRHKAALCPVALCLVPRPTNAGRMVGDGARAYMNSTLPHFGRGRHSYPRVSAQ